MTEPVDFAVSLARLEGKVDTLTVKVDAGDKASAGLVELLKNELGGLRRSFEEFKTDVRGDFATHDSAISKVRTDLEGELEGQQRSIDRLEAWQNRIIGGLILANVIATGSLVTMLVSHLSH